MHFGAGAVPVLPKFGAGPAPGPHGGFLGWYDNIAKHAGAGVLVPITGFANSMVSPAMEFKSEGFITGLGAKLFTVAGPVLVFGVTASVVYGLVIFFFQI